MKLPFEIDLKDKVVVVTGAGGVICSSLAEAIAQCGAKVALLDLNQEAADRAAAKIVAEGFIFAPGKRKRPHLKMAEAIISTLN